MPRVVRGIIIAPLQECFSFLIIMTPDRIFFLRNGMTCAYAPGTRLKVVYTENDDGVKDVVSLQAASRKDRSEPMPRGVTPLVRQPEDPMEGTYNLPPAASWRLATLTLERQQGQMPGAGRHRQGVGQYRTVGKSGA